jgi:acyl-[acyl-carrier-protein]-phospholipid O-acyltransferase/long-chain-fatty-acid--[acyl-carrier-protein] ligase
MERSIYERWYLKGVLRLCGAVPIEQGPSARNTIQTIASLLDEGEVVCLFPEGVISRTGHLAEFRSGYEKACALTQTDVQIVPFYLRGLWGSQFSRASDMLKTLRSSGLSREIIVAFGQPIPKSTSVDILKRRIFDLSIVSWEEYAQSLPTIPVAWISTVKRMGGDMAVADSQGASLSASRALTTAVILSRRMQQSSRGDNIGLLLPTSSTGMLANMAGLLAGRAVVNLNYTASLEALQAALVQADLDSVFTSRAFVERLAQRGLNVEVLGESVKLHYLEDIQAGVGKVESLATMLMVKLLPARLLQALFCRTVPVSATAAILFSSGSEGQPKGVMLSHTNIMANLKQTADVFNLRDDDVVMAELPLFHAFGLTVTQFMPLIEGLPVVCHPDPTDTNAIARAVATYRATIFTATATLLRLYIRNPKVNSLMFDSLRLVIAGAEKLNDDVREAFKLKFNKDIYEGYGATETTPVASVNLPNQLDTSWWSVQQGNKPGTVGMPLPGSSFKIVDPDSLLELPTGEAGLILIGGCQVMKGYLKQPDKTAAVIIEQDGVRWYKTGDKGAIDKDGFLTILDRYSRFAKIGGEMVSLGAVEASVREALAQPDLEVAAVNLADAAKGEKIVLLYAGDLAPDAVRKQLISAKMNALMLPAKIVPVDAVPKLGSGKTDFSSVRAVAEAAEKAD